MPGALGVVALGGLADPVWRVARHARSRAPCAPGPAAKGSATRCVLAALWPPESVLRGRRRPDGVGDGYVWPCRQCTATGPQSVSPHVRGGGCSIKPGAAATPGRPLLVARDGRLLLQIRSEGLLHLADLL